MAHVIVDRRRPEDTNGNSTNRQKFIRRIKNRLSAGVKKAIREGSIKDLADGKGQRVIIKQKGLTRPTFNLSHGGVSEQVFTGNKQFIAGDRINRPEGKGEGEGGTGNGASDSDAIADDEFAFDLTGEEFSDLFFEDLGLPNLQDTKVKTTVEYAFKRSGFASTGTPSRMNIVRSMRQAKSRRTALRGASERKLKKLLKEETALTDLIAQRTQKGDPVDIELDKLADLTKEIDIVRKKIKAIPYIDDTDLRFVNFSKQPIPNTQAVMFCVMDVSGSMGEWEKEMSKRFFMLLYMFLRREYDNTEVVFIRHHTTASEVDEEEFYNSRETGGTLVSPALELVDTIIADRYPPDRYNIYVSQASDGDNWDTDNHVTIETLKTKLLPKVRYFAYIELDQYEREGDMWPHYTTLKESQPKLALARIRSVEDIWAVFQQLFTTKR